MQLKESGNDKTEWQFGIFVQNGYDEEEENDLAIYFGPWYRWYKLDKQWFAPESKWVDTSHYEWATPGPDGRCGYTSKTRKKYGFRLDKHSLAIFHGLDTDSWPNPDQTNIYFPFTEYRRVHMDFLDHELNFVERYQDNVNGSINFDSLRDVESRAPILEMEFKDYDGTVVKATARFTRSKYRLGTKWAKFLGYLVPSKMYHHIDLNFDQEVGPQKGSWKGGTMGITTQRFPEESARDCMIRVCKGEGLTLLQQ